MADSMAIDEVQPEARDDLRRAARTMILVRWLAAPWVLAQIIAYEIPYPAGYQTRAFAFLGVLVAGNSALTIAHYGSDGQRRARTIGILGLALDVAVLSAFVWLYAFDYQTQIWAVLFIAPLEGAILFQLWGALAAWAVIAISYALRDIWAHNEYGNPLIWNSITFRMGVGGIIALVAGLMARDLWRQRTRLYEALDEIRRIDRMRSGLVSMLGHDVRSPLTVIRGVVSTLLSRAGTVTPEDQKALLESADRQARRLEALANDLLDLARMDQGRLELELEEVDVQELTRSALSYVENGGDIQIDVDRGLKVMADPRRLEQVLINLVGNALRHGAPPVLVTGRANGNIASIEVVDHGVGVPEKELSRLFEPFNTERKSGSIGYGLAIVRALIEAHGGTVAYSSEKGGGARFRLTLDRAPTSAT